MTADGTTRELFATVLYKYIVYANVTSQHGVCVCVDEVVVVYVCVWLMWNRNSPKNNFRNA